MYKYGIINNKLRMLDLTTEHMNPTTVSLTPSKQTTPTVTLQLMESPSGNRKFYNINIDAKTSSLPVNIDSLNKLKTAIVENKYTDIMSVYPRMRIKLDYMIEDSNGNIVEEGSRVRICNIHSSYTILPITTENDQQYSDAIECNDTFDIGINVTTLGISKNFASKEFKMTIKNIELSVAVSDKRISDSYLTAYQNRIGWSPTSPTQEELGEYYCTVYSAIENNPSWEPIVIDKLPKLMRCMVQVNASADLFANVENCAEIESLIIENQRATLKYHIATTVDGAAIDPIEDITYKTHSIVEATIPRKAASVKINDTLYTFADSDYDDAQDPVLHKTIDDYVFTVVATDAGYNVSVYFESIVTNYTVEITSATE